MASARNARTIPSGSPDAGRPAAAEQVDTAWLASALRSILPHHPEFNLAGHQGVVRGEAVPQDVVVRTSDPNLNVIVAGGIASAGAARLF